MLDAVYLSGGCAAPPIAAEVRSDVFGAHCAHAATVSRACQYALVLDVINLHYFGLPTVSCFHPRYYSLGNRRDQQFGPCFKLGNR